MLSKSMFSHIGSLFTCDLAILLLYFGLQPACEGTSIGNKL